MTGADGRFATRCPLPWRGAGAIFVFAVRHPAHLDGRWEVPAQRGDTDAGVLELEKIPLEGGVHVLGGAGFGALAPAPLYRAAEGEALLRWCLVPGEGAPTEVPAGRVRFLDNHVSDWKLFRVDAEGCAYRMQRGMGSHWGFEADEVPVAGTEALSPGRTWVDVDLAAGDYVVADWYAGFLVREEGERWRGGWVRAR